MRRLFKIGSERHSHGPVTFSWHPDCNFIASAGSNGVIQITDRHGDIVDEIPMATQAAILALAWDKDGEFLAILQEGNSIIALWNLSSRRVIPLDTNLKDPSFIAWSKSGPQLAVGTSKGNLLIYNKTKKQKIPIVGKHSKKIISGMWSSVGNKLILGSEDNTFTVSNEVGDTLLHTEMKYTPMEVKFSPVGDTSSSDRENNKPSRKHRRRDDMVSVNLGERSLQLYNLSNDKEQPIELDFGANRSRDSDGMSKYGSLKHHQWFDSETLLLGFSGGYLLLVSAVTSGQADEKKNCRLHPSNMEAFSYNNHLKRTASAGRDGVRILDHQDFMESKDDFISTPDLEDGMVTSLDWSPDGQILTVATDAGNVYNFLAKMSVLHASYKSSVCFLSSLCEVAVVDTIRRSRPLEIGLKIEPTLLAMGAKHVAAAMNNRVYYHRITSNVSAAAVVHEQEYIGSVADVRLNNTYAVVLSDQKAKLHLIEPNDKNAKNGSFPMSFPLREDGNYSRITCITMTEELFLYGTEAGTVEVFFLGECTLLSGAELRLDNPIKSLHCNHNGTRVVVVDSTNQVFLYNPVTGGGVNQSILKFEMTPVNIVNIMWDHGDGNVVMIYDGKSVHSYVYASYSMKGAFLTKLGPVDILDEGEVQLSPEKIEVEPGNIPLICVSGVFTCQTTSGNLSTLTHPLFVDIIENDNTSRNVRRSAYESPAFGKKGLSLRDTISRFGQTLALLKLEGTWKTALELDKRQYWLALAGKAMEMLNIDVAIRVYRQLGDAGMVMALEQCMHIEDKFLLAGHVALLFGNYSRAQELFLSSSHPIAALEMRRDLLHWDQALKLSQTLAVQQIPDICYQYGQQLEFRDAIEKALRMYEMALNTTDAEGNNACPEALTALAMAGVVRGNMKLGNIRQGLRLANELQDKQLFGDCGDVLEQQKQYGEAASMHIKAEQFERAAVIYTKYLIKADKSRITEAAGIMEKVKNNDQLNSAFAKACMGAGRHEEAVRAYERAKDTDKVVELQLNHLGQAQQAFDLVRSTSSAQGALLVAEYCQKANDFRGAIEFLLIANKSQEAFHVAQSQAHMETYTMFLGEQISSDDALKVAHFYEKAQDLGKAGRFYSLCGHYPRALKLFMQCGDKEIDAAIEVVGKGHNEALTHQLIDFLVGEKDGIPKDPNYIYRLYMALKKFEDAEKTAMIIAQQEQDMGNYDVARGVIVETVCQLENAEVHVSTLLRNQFVLLHSYLLAKSALKANDSMAAARLLLRVVQHISKFPLQVVPILTSCVIACSRAGLKTSSYEYAAMLMKPEHRSSIKVEIKKQIEGIVRKKNSLPPDVEAEMSTCPITSDSIPAYSLECSSKDSIPMCVVTGRHMVLADWCVCPVSKFPALYSEYVRYIQESEIVNSVSAGGGTAAALDPLLGKPVKVDDLKLCSSEEAMAYIQVYNNVKDQSKKTDKDASNGPVNKTKSPSPSPKNSEPSPVRKPVNNKWT